MLGPKLDSVDKIIDIDVGGLAMASSIWGETFLPLWVIEPHWVTLLQLLVL